MLLRTFNLILQMREQESHLNALRKNGYQLDERRLTSLVNQRRQLESTLANHLSEIDRVVNEDPNIDFVEVPYDRT